MAHTFVSKANRKKYTQRFNTEDWQQHHARFLLDRAKPDMTFVTEIADKLRVGADDIDLIDYGDSQRSFKRGFILRNVERGNMRVAVATAEFIYSGTKEGILTVNAKNSYYMDKVLNGLRNYAHLAQVETRVPIVHRMEARV